ncbi:MAG TPA: hypothetical protein VIX86_11375 [Streptosporangiaceae bacterium]
MAIEAVPRWYHQTAFRSSLEADWACSLDRLGIGWQYEPVGVQLPTGDGYVPDFWLPAIGTYLEVKGDQVPGRWKAHDLARMTACQCKEECRCQWPGGQVVIIGRPPTWSPASDTRYTLTWEDPLSANTPLVRCQSCHMWAWVRLRDGLNCRGCGTRVTGHLIPPREYPASFADRTMWTVVR